jgi:DNA invertase Pin-like site-specific DNA recombinase
MTTRTRVIGYVRVSTDQQADGGVSLEAQEAKLRAYCLAMDLDLVRIETDAGLSAKSLARRGLQAALQSLDAGEADGLLVCKLDRLTRSVKDLGTLVETYFASRFSLLSLGDSIDTRSAAGRLVLNVLASVSQWEREACAERTRDALAHLKAQGVKLGAPAVDDPSTIRMIRELHAGGLSLRAIVLRLEAANVPTKKGGRWSPAVVRRIAQQAA